MALDARPGQKPAEVLAFGAVLDPPSGISFMDQFDQLVHGVATPPTSPNPRTLLHQAGPGHLPALTRGANDVGHRYAHFVEEHLVEVGRSGHFPERANLDTGTAHIEDECRDAARTL